MKKKNIIVILLLLIPFLFVCGMSTWIILKEKGVILNYKPADVLNKYITDTEIVTYSGEEKTPTISSNLVNFGELKFEYKNYDPSNDSFKLGKPIDAGHYLVRISVKDLANAEDITRLVDFTIEPLELELNQKIVDFDYDSTIRDWSKIKEKKIINSIDFKNGAKTYKLSTTDFDIIGMHDGTFAYGNPDYINDLKNTQKLDVNNNNITGIKDNTNVVGSTYLATVKLTNSNYKIKNSSDNTSNFIVKYKTAMIGSTYYTIEDAISKSGNITFPGNSSSTTSFVYTAFSNLNIEIYSNFSIADIYTLNYTITNGNLFIPFENSTTALKKEKKSNPSSTNVYTALIIPSANITLTFNNSKTLTLAAVIAGSGKTGIHGALVNNGIINFQNGTKIISYGYIKGKGIINLFNGASAQDTMILNDWGSASSASAVKDAGAFPLVSWSMHNISCNTKIYKGAEYTVYTSIYGTTVGYNNVTATIIGASSSSTNCLFKPSSSSIDDHYILKYGTDLNLNFLINVVDSNQNSKNQKDNIEIYGNYEDGKLKVALSGYSFETSISMAATLPNFNLTIKENYIFLIKNSSYVFLLGSTCTIEENAILYIYNGAYVAFDSYKNGKAVLTNYSVTYIGSKTNAYMMNNGKIIASGTLSGETYNGFLGGMIKTNTSGAILLANYNISEINVKTSGNGATKNVNYHAYGQILASNGSREGEFSSGTYYSNGQSWYSEIGNINFDSCGGSSVDPIPDISFGELGYTITESILIGKEPTRAHYTFKGWYLDANYTLPAIDQVIFASTTLYAKWDPIPYNITYDMNNYEGITDPINNPKNNDNNPIEFTIETRNVALLSAINPNDNSENKYVFDGWYLDLLFENRISAINGDEIIALGFTDLTLYCRWYPSDTKTYRINYVINTDYDIDFPSSVEILSTAIDKYTIPTTISQYNTDYLKELYFEGWYLESTFNSKIDSSNLSTAFSDDITEITLYARWENKISITLNYDSIQQVVYYIPGKIHLPSLSSYSPEGKENETMIWFTKSNKITTNYYIGGLEYDINSNLIVYGEFYYIVSLSDFTNNSFKKENGHVNILIKDIDLSSISQNITVTWGGSTASAVKQGGFYDCNIEKIILDNTNGTLKLNMNSVSKSDRTSVPTGACSTTTYYCYFYLGLFDSNPLTQVILNNVKSENIPQYIFSNPTNTGFSLSKVYSSEVLTLTNAIPKDVTSTTDVNNNGLAGSGETKKVSSLEYTYNKYNIPLYVVISVIMISLLSFVTVTYVKKQKKIRK